jgi:hypothetical protein
MTTRFCKAGKLNSIDSEFRSHDLEPIVHLFLWVTSMPAAFYVQLDNMKSPISSSKSGVA